MLEQHPHVHSYLSAAQELEEASDASQAAGGQPPRCLQGPQSVQGGPQRLIGHLLQHLLPQLLCAEVLPGASTSLQNWEREKPKLKSEPNTEKQQERNQA